MINVVFSCNSVHSFSSTSIKYSYSICVLVVYSSKEKARYGIKRDAGRIFLFIFVVENSIVIDLGLVVPFSDPKLITSVRLCNNLCKDMCKIHLLKKVICHKFKYASDPV